MASNVAVGSDSKGKCSRCGAVNPFVNRVCAQCGATLPHAAKPAPLTAAPSQPAPDQDNYWSAALGQNVPAPTPQSAVPPAPTLAAPSPQRFDNFCAHCRTCHDLAHPHAIPVDEPSRLLNALSFALPPVGLLSYLALAARQPRQAAGAGRSAFYGLLCASLLLLGLQAVRQNRARPASHSGGAGRIVTAAPRGAAARRNSRKRHFIGVHPGHRVTSPPLFQAHRTTRPAPATLPEAPPPQVRSGYEGML